MKAARKRLLALCLTVAMSLSLFLTPALAENSIDTTIVEDGGGSTVIPPEDDSSDVTTPEDDSSDVTTPEDDSSDVTTPEDDSSDVTTPEDDGSDVAPPEADSSDVASPEDDGFDVTPPEDDSSDVTPPEDDTSAVTPEDEESPMVTADGPDGATTITATASRTIRKDNQADGEPNFLRLKYANGDGFHRMVTATFLLSGVNITNVEATLRLYTTKVESNFTNSSYGMYVTSITNPADISDTTTYNFNMVASYCFTNANNTNTPINTPIARITTSAVKNNWLEIDVSDAVKAALASSASSITFIGYPPQYDGNGNNGIEFYSTQYSDSSMHPQLVIEPAPTIMSIEQPAAMDVPLDSTDDILPATVTATMSNGSTREVPVTWSVTNEFTTTGQKTIEGTVDGYDGKVTISVTVKGLNVPPAETVNGALLADVYVQSGTYADTTPNDQKDGPAYDTTWLRMKNSNGSDGRYTRRICMLYNISQVPKNAYQVQIVLTTVSTADTAKPVEGHYVGGGFYVLNDSVTAADLAENSITFNQTNGWVNNITTPDGTFSSSVVDGKVYIDITEQVVAAKVAGKSTIGILLRSPTPADENGINFYSSRASNGLGPALIVQDEPMIKSITPVNVTTPSGTYPTLPSTVHVTTKEGKQMDAAVTWDTIPKGSYTAVGTFKVTGRLDNWYGVEVEATVTVSVPVGYKGTTYYVSTSGSNSNPGTSESQPFANFDKFNNAEIGLLPGDKVLLKRGDTFNGYLLPIGSGTEDAPITISSYGDASAPMPIINGNGTTYSLYSATIMLYNVSHYVVDGLEVTNRANFNQALNSNSDPYIRGGIYVYTCDDYVGDGFEIKNCYVHDVATHISPNDITNASGGSGSAKISGGIIVQAEHRDRFGVQTWQTNGHSQDSEHLAGFTNVDIHNNIVQNVAHEGIRTKVNGHWDSSDPNAYPRRCSNVHIYDNYIESTLGDGIVVGENDHNANIVVERNVVKDAAKWSNPGAYYAGVWVHYGHDVVFQYNEVYGTRYGSTDAEAFDADHQSDGTIFQYNYSHNNWGGFVLLMQYQTNTTIRYNISASDGWGGGEEIINDHSTSGNAAKVPNVYNNTFYIDSINSGTNLYGCTTGSSFAKFRNNIVLAATDSITLKFSKSSTLSSSVIENNLFSSTSIFSANMPFTTEQLQAKNNIFDDPKLANPELTKEHDKTDMAAIGGTAAVWALLEDGKVWEDFIKPRIAEAFTPAPDSPVLGKGQVIAGNTLTKDILGNAIRSTPSIGAIEPQDPAQAPTITTNLDSTASVTIGEKLTLSVIASSPDNGTLTYQWYKDDSPISGETGSSCTITSAAQSDAGTYHVVVTNTLNATTAAATSVKCVVTVDKITLSGSIAIHGDAKFGETLTADVTNLEPQGASVTYAWIRNNTTIGTGESYTLTEADIGNVVTLAVTGTGDYTGDVSVSTETVVKADGPEAPAHDAFTITGESAKGASDGSITTSIDTTNLEWMIESGSEWAAFTSPMENLAPGKYHIRYAETATHLHSESLILTVLAYGMTQADTPNASFNAATMTLSGVTTEMKYSLDGGETWSAITGDEVVLAEGDVTTAYGIQVYQKGDGVDTVDSDPQIIHVTQADEPDLGSRAPATADANGAITGTSTAMEYRSKGQTAWTPCTGSETEAAPGTYEVRVAGTGAVLASHIVEVVIHAYTPPSGGTAVTGVSLNRGSVSLYSNASPRTVTLTAAVAPADADNKAVRWSSSNESVATVDANGVVTAVGNGSAAITVTTAEGGFTASCTVTVSTYTAPSTSGSSNTKPSRPQSVVTTNPDGSKTTTVTDKASGTVTATTTYPDGKVEEFVTKKDGSTTQTVTETDGKVVQTAVSANKDKTITITSPSGEVKAKVSIPAQAAPPNEQFIDVTNNHWAKDAVDAMSGMSIMQGVGGNRFDGEADVTRGMFVTMLHRLSGELPPEQAAQFEDVTNGQWYSQAIAWAEDNSIVSGVSANQFAPDGQLTREALAVMLYRYADFLGMETENTGVPLFRYSDAPQVSGWAAEAMNWAVSNGLLQGVGENRLDPGGNATRYQIAVVFERFVNLLK